MSRYEGSHQMNGIATVELPDLQTQTITAVAASHVTAPNVQAA
jgi:hypothetical protein